MVKKRLTLLISGLGSLLLVAIGTFGTYSLCNENVTCVDILHNYFLHFLPILALFVFSCITYRMPESVFQTWAKFAMVWIPLSMLAILVSPEYDGAFVPLFPIIKGTVAFASSALFVAISTLLIGWLHFKKS